MGRTELGVVANVQQQQKKAHKAQRAISHLGIHATVAGGSRNAPEADR